MKGFFSSTAFRQASARPARVASGNVVSTSSDRGRRRVPPHRHPRLQDVTQGRLVLLRTAHRAHPAEPPTRTGPGARRPARALLGEGMAHAPRQHHRRLAAREQRSPSLSMAASNGRAATSAGLTTRSSCRGNVPLEMSARLSVPRTFAATSPIFFREAERSSAFPW